MARLSATGARHLDAGRVPGGRATVRRVLVGVWLAAVGGPAWALAAPPAASQVEARIPARLDLATALSIFRTSGLDLLIADAAVDAARGDERIARTIADPALSLGAGRTATYDPSACPGCSDVQLSVGVSDQAALLDALVGKRRLRIDVARAALEAASRSRADAERTGALVLKEQYLASELAASAREYARLTAESASETFRLVDVRYRAGAVSEADSALAESAKLEAEQAVSQAAESERQAKAALAFLLGVRGSAPEFEVERGFSRALVPARLVDATAASLLESALANRPDLKEQEAQRARARAGLALARRERVPDVALSLGYTQEGRGQSALQPPTTTVGLAFTLPVFDRRQGEIARAEADVRAQELQLAKGQAQVTADVETAYAAFTGARERTARMEARLLERAERARDLVKIQYDKGAASLLDVLVAERSLIAARAEYLQDLSGFWTAVFELEAAVGEELR